MKTFYRGYVIETKRDGYGVHHVVRNEVFSLLTEAVAFINKKLEEVN